MPERTRTRLTGLGDLSDSASLPEGWDILTLGEMFSRRIEKGRRGLPVMSITMKEGLVERDFLDRRVDTNLAPEGHLLARAGDLAYNMMRMWQGVLGRAKFDCLVSPAYVVLQPNGKLEPEFAEYLLSTDSAIAKFKRMSYGVVDDRLRLYYHDLVRIPFRVPRSRVEQKRIASVLLAADEAIEQTESQIEKYQRIKAGLMRDLFTRGVTPDGHLRPSRVHAPHLYKCAGSIWIPDGWQASSLRECAEFSSGGTPNRQKGEWWVGEVPWLTPKDMKTFELNDTSEHISHEAAMVASRIAKSGSVFIVVRGMILAHSFPVVLGLRDFAFNQDIKALRPQGSLSGKFLAYWLTAHQGEFLKLTTEATHGTKRLELKHLQHMPIGLPSRKEQAAMVERLDSVFSAVAEGMKQAEKLRSLRVGLMNELLTGRVRVRCQALQERSA